MRFHWSCTLLSLGIRQSLLSCTITRYVRQYYWYVNTQLWHSAVPCVDILTCDVHISLKRLIADDICTCILRQYGHMEFSVRSVTDEYQLSLMHATEKKINKKENEKRKMWRTGNLKNRCWDCKMAVPWQVSK